MFEFTETQILNFVFYALCPVAGLALFKILITDWSAKDEDE